MLCAKSDENVLTIFKVIVAKLLAYFSSTVHGVCCTSFCSHRCITKTMTMNAQGTSLPKTFFAATTSTVTSTALYV